MNISPIIPNYIPQRRNSEKINFGCNKSIKLQQNIPDSTLLTAKEIVDNVFKLVNKIQFVNKILGENDKTAKPVLAKLGDASVYINMDKSAKDKIRINLFSDTAGSMYKYSSELQGYIPVKNPEMQRQSLDIIVNKKDKRMINGQLTIVDCNMDFARDTKTGKREIHSNKCFCFVPNLYECYDIQDVAVQFWTNNKESNIVTSVFFNMFANLTKVKPDISLIK